MDATDDRRVSLAQLAQILSALENERRNPNTKRNAIKGIERNAAQFGLSTEDVFDAADGLLSGRMSDAEFRAQLRDNGCRPATFMTEPAAEPAPDGATDEPADAYLMPKAGPLAVARSGTGDDAAADDVAEAAEDAPVAATAAVAANPATTETRVGGKSHARPPSIGCKPNSTGPEKPGPTRSSASCVPPSSGPKARGSLASRSSRVDPGTVRARALRRR